MIYPRERAITDLHTPTGSRDIEVQSHKHRRPYFLDFKPHEDQYDVRVALLKNNGKIKVKYKESYWSDLFEILQANGILQQVFIFLQIPLP